MNSFFFLPWSDPFLLRFDNIVEAMSKCVRLVSGIGPANDAHSIENSAVCNMALQNKLDSKVSEAKLIEMLERTSAGVSQARGEAAGKISIQRKRYNFDSDSDDENDDDLL